MSALPPIADIDLDGGDVRFVPIGDIALPRASGRGVRYFRSASALPGRTDMKLPHRRQFLHLAGGAAALPAVPHIARAQAYPSRPITMLVAFAAGGSGDTIMRSVADHMRSTLGQTIVIEN